MDIYDTLTSEHCATVKSGCQDYFLKKLLIGERNRMIVNKFPFMIKIGKLLFIIDLYICSQKE